MARVGVQIEDAIDSFLRRKPAGATTPEIYEAVERKVPEASRHSVRRTLHAGTSPFGDKYTRIGRGKYKLARR
jgi:hypothetical protein